VLISFSDFARLKGVSAPAVTTACKSRITDAIVEHNGKRMLDRDKALELWDRNTKRNGSERVSADAQHRDRRKLKPDVAGARLPPPAQVPNATGDQLKSLIMGLPEDQIPGLDVSRERPRFQERCHPFDPSIRGLEDMTNASLQRGRQG
jgi:hypothetical protein